MTVFTLGKALFYFIYILRRFPLDSESNGNQASHELS